MFFDFSGLAVYFAGLSLWQWILGIALPLILLLVVPLVYSRWSWLDVYLQALEWIFVAFFLILAVPGLANYSIQAGRSPTLILLAVIVLMMVLFSRLVISAKRAADRNRSKTIKAYDQESRSRQGTSHRLAYAAVVGLIIMLVLRRRQR